MADDVFTLELEESPGGSASESDRTINKNISNIISLLNTPSPESRKQQTSAMPKSALATLLKDVIAFVDVRSTFENRSKAITSQLVQLGATVEPKLSNEVTHVIFKDGKKATRDKAKKKGLHFVSVLWIEACKRTGEHVQEASYPANVKDDSALPLAITRLKKNKSMQPKDFEEELANSAEKMERKRKRLEKKEKWKVLETPVTPHQYNRGQFYVAETQSMSPVHLFASNISIPETPPSMRKKLEALRRKKLQDEHGSESLEGLSIQESPSTPPDNELQKRLFSSTATTPMSSDSSIMASPVTVPRSRLLPQSPLVGASPLTKVQHRNIVHSPLFTSRRVIPPLSVDSIPPVNFQLTPEAVHKVDKSTKVSKSKRKSSSPKQNLFSSTAASPGEVSASKQNIRRQVNPKCDPESPILAMHNVDAPTNLSPIKPKSRRKSMVQKRNLSVITPVMEDSTVVELNVTKSKSRKKKLLSLEEHLPEKLLSPVIYHGPVQSKSDLPEFPKPQKSAKGNSTIVLPDSVKAKPRGRKRKTDELSASDSDGSERQKRTKSNAEHKQMDAAEKQVVKNKGKIQEKTSTFVDNVANTSKPQVVDTHELLTGAKSSKGRRQSLATPVTPVTPRTSRRRSCMPAVTPASSKLLPIQEDNMRRTSKTADETPSVQDDCESQSAPCAIDVDTPEMVTNNPPAARANRRKSVQPQKSPVKATTTIIQRRSRRSSVLSASLASDLSRDSDATRGKHNDKLELTSKICASLAGESLLVENSISDISLASNSSNPHSMSRSYNSTLSNLKTSRRSIEEFLMPKSGRLKKKAVSMSPAIDSSGSDDEPTHTGSQGAKSSQGKSKAVKKKKKVDKKLRHNSGSSSDGNCCRSVNQLETVKKRKDGCSRSLVMTSLHAEEQDSVRAVAKNLGSFYVEEHVSPHTTHVVCGSNRRTLNILLAISQGCWIISQEWVFKSLEAGDWLDEEPYEQNSFFPAAQMSRIAKISGGDKYCCGVFSQHGLIYVGENTSPSHQELVHLLQLCGAQVTHCVRKAQVCVGTGCSRTDVMQVSEKWILDSISTLKHLSYDQYLL